MRKGKEKEEKPSSKRAILSSDKWAGQRPGGVAVYTGTFFNISGQVIA